MSIIPNKLLWFSYPALCLIASVLAGCGGNDGSTSAKDTPVSITITPASASLAKGSSVGLKAIADFADGKVSDISASAQWTSADPAIATVDATSGLATGIAPGTVTIMASLNGSLNASAQINITAATLTAIHVASNAGTVSQEEITTFTALGSYSDNTSVDISKQVIWNSSHGAVARIDSHGIATGISAGDSLITARLGKVVSNAATLTVAYSLRGNLSGLIPGNNIALTNNQGDRIVLNSNGAFSFPSRLASGAIYKLSISSHPAGQPCSHLYGVGKVQRTRTPAFSVFCGLPVRGEMSRMASLTNARRDHTTTLLTDGRVLAVGGVGVKENLAGTELYDPATGNWLATGSLASARRGHTATLLHDGSVLVAGGLGASFSRLDNADLYDAKTGKWTVTGHLATARSQHTATLLPDGKVLVMGGVGPLGTGTLTSAELYDPSTRQWKTTGNLNTARSQHTAILLPDGKVLVSGGVGAAQTGTLASTEVYDPVAGSWTATGSLNTARSQHSITLLPSGFVLVAGGIGSAGNLASAELFNPNTGRWTPTANLASMRYLHTATLLPTGKVLVTGGVGANGGQLASSEVFDPETARWYATGNLITERTQHTATLLSDGKLLLSGGTGKSVLADNELYW